MNKLFIFLFYFILLNNSYSESTKSIEIIADEMEWNKQKNEAIAIGNAKATKGNNVITANKIIGTLTDTSMDQRIIKLIALGKVKFTRMGEVATGEKAIYDLEKDIIVIKGNVRLKKNENVMVGESLIINLNTGLSKMSGSKNNNKVKMKYNTKNK
jgi:lipopolysaccharide export system protein LptA